MTTLVSEETHFDSEPRPIWPAMLNGMRCRCPRCGKGRLLHSYLKVNDRCSECGEEFFHHRADDLPPYVAIMIVGHILVTIMFHMETIGAGSPFVYLAVFVPLSIIMPLAMLPSIKGAVVGLQWSRRMHGFAGAGRMESKSELIQ